MQKEVKSKREKDYISSVKLTVNRHNKQVYRVRDLRAQRVTSHGVTGATCRAIYGTRTKAQVGKRITDAMVRFDQWRNVQG